MSRTPSFLKRTSNALPAHRRRAREAGRHLDYGLDDLRHHVAEALRCPCRYCGVALTGGHRRPLATCHGGWQEPGFNWFGDEGPASRTTVPFEVRPGGAPDVDAG